MNDDDFWGEFAIDYGGGSSSFNPDIADNVGAFDLGGALNYPGSNINFSDFIKNFPDIVNPSIFDVQDFGKSLFDTSWIDTSETGPFDWEGFSNVNLGGGSNYLTDGLSIPGQGFEAPSTSLYEAAGEAATVFPGEGLKEPEIPGMTYMGGAQGLYAEVPTQYDAAGNPIPGSGGYITQMGFIPYEATPALGDPRSFINDPKVLGRPVFTNDEIRFPDGTVVKVDPRTGETTRTKEGGAGGKGSGTTKQTPKEKLQQIINNRRINIRPPDIPELERFTPGRGSLFNPFAGQGEIPLARMDLGSIGNIFPSENVLDRLSGQMPIRVAEGGSIEGEHNPEFYSEGGSRYVRGDGDGTSDSVPAMLARGEYVIPADVVSNLGNGDNEAGAEIMDEFLNVVRSHKRSAHPEDLPEDSKGPLAYLEEAQKNVRD